MTRFDRNSDFRRPWPARPPRFCPHLSYHGLTTIRTPSQQLYALPDRGQLYLMAPRKGVPNGATLSPVPSSSSLTSDPHPTVKVNNANLSDIKSALDDVVKKVEFRSTVSDSPG